MAVSEGLHDLLGKLSGFPLDTLDREGKAPIHYIMDLKSEEEAMKYLKGLIEAGANPNTPDSKETRAIHQAVRKNWFQAASLLCFQEIDLNVKNKEGDLPLNTAIVKRSYRMVELLMQSGANPSLSGKGKETGLFLSKNSKEIRELILSYEKKEKKCRATTFDQPLPLKKSESSNRKNTLDSNNKSKGSAEELESEDEGESDEEIGDLSNPEYQKFLIKDTAKYYAKLEQNQWKEKYKNLESQQSLLKSRNKDLEEINANLKLEISQLKASNSQNENVTPSFSSLVLNSSIFVPQFHSEILQYQEQVDKNNSKLKSLVEELVSLIDCKVKLICKTLSIQTYGSWAVGLNIPESDIDLCLVDSAEKKEFTGVEIFAALENLLKNEDWVNDTKNISSAKIPVFKIQTSETFKKIWVDITLRNSGHAGITSIGLIGDFLNLYKPLKPMMLVLKKFLYALELEDPYRGGLTSYGLFLMIVAFLQSSNLHRIDIEKIESPFLGKLVLDFLKFYSDFDSTRCLIYVFIPELGPVRPSFDLIKAGIDDDHFGSFIVILDPLNYHNNVGRCTFRFKEIQKSFSIALTLVHLHCGQEGTLSKLLNWTPVYVKNLISN